DIMSFVKRFVDVQEAGVKVLDKRRIWNGKRKYMVHFRSDPKAGDGLLHPQAFSIGANRGYLFYPEQPLTCRRCGQGGHFAVDCKAEVQYVRNVLL
ncbi:ZCHC3 protein, partial [Atractosteus spatula]|nr:ZCHC3 protein [Atractosteus spatula]